MIKCKFHLEVIMKPNSRMLNILGVILICVFILILSVPTLLSTSWGKGQIVAILNQEISGNVSIEEISLSWFGTQKINGVSLSGPNGKEALTFKSLTASIPLPKLLLSNFSSTDLRIQSLNTSIDQELKNALGEKYRHLKFPSHPIDLKNISVEIGSDISIEAKGKTLQNGKEGSFNLTKINDDTEIDIQEFPTELIDLVISLAKPDAPISVSQLLGNSVSLSLQKKESSSGVAGIAKIRSSRLQMDGQVKVSQNILFIDQPLKISMTLTPDLLKATQWKLNKSANIEFIVNEGKIPLAFSNGGLNLSALSDLLLHAQLKTSALELSNNEGGTTRLKNFQSSISAPKGSNTFTLETKGSLSQSGNEIPFSLHAKHHKPSHADKLVESLLQPTELKFLVNSINTATLDSLFSTGETFRNAFGNRLSLSIYSDGKDLKTVVVDLSSDNMQIPNLKLSINNEVRIGQEITSQHLEGTLKADRFIFKTDSGSNTVTDLNVDWIVSSGFKGAKVNFSAQSEGFVQGMIDAKFNKEDLPDIAAKISGKQLSTQFLTLISGRKEWGPAFGPYVDLTIDTTIRKMKGPFKLNITGTTGFIKVDGQMNNGQLTLNTPLVIQAEASERLGKEVLSDFAPVFGEMLSAESPIRLVVDKEGFSIPINFDFSKASFDRATLDMGKMTFRNSGDVNRLLGVLKAGNYPEVSIWTTPLHVNMKKGILSIYRMDILLVERYPLATWGKIDLASDRVNMVLGLSANSLSSAFGVQGLNDTYMLQVPIKGTTSNTKIDSNKAMTRVAALMAQSGGGPEGLVLGTVFDIANGKEPRVPEPTTKPLPWKDLIISENQASATKKSTKNPLNGIQKEASKFLKGMFR